MSSEKLYQDLRGLYGLPRFIANREGNYIIVEGSETNKTHFDDYFKINQHLVPTDTNIYYYSPEDYDMLIKEMARIEDLAEAQKRQDKIDNPEIKEEIANIQGLNQLIEFLILEYNSANQYFNDEYSVDIEVSEARLNAEVDCLRELKENYLS